MSAALLDPLTLKGVTLPNRIVISPMQQYMAGRDGLARDWHFVHLAKMAVGGAGLVFTEALAIEPDARVIADSKGASVTVDIHHAVAAILEEEKRRLETERQLAEEVHEAYRERMADRIQRDPTPFMKE